MEEGQQQPERPASRGELFSSVVTAYTINLLRAVEAMAAHTAMMGALPVIAVRLRQVPPEVLTQVPDDLKAALQMVTISHDEYDAFVYVSNVSMLVYHTTLFDTFIQDTIEFLLCLHPQSIRESAVSFDRVLKANSREELLNTAIKAKVRDLGFESFSERLRWLRKRFGVDCKLSEEASAEIAHFGDVRNSIVHDQGFFDFFIDGKGEVALQHRACSRHPTVVTRQDVSKARSAFTQAVVSIATAVMEQVLKEAPSQPVARMLNELRDGTSSAQP